MSMGLPRFTIHPLPPFCPCTGVCLIGQLWLGNFETGETLMTTNTNQKNRTKSATRELKYEIPKIITLDKETLLQELGPARACYGYTSGSVVCTP